MRSALGILLALIAAPVFAQSSSAGTGINGTGVQLSATANQTVGSKLVTVTVGNGSPASIKTAPNTNPPGTEAGTFSAGLSIGATLGNGFGSTSGTGGTMVGFR
jgi:hypothetical protein